MRCIRNSPRKTFYPMPARTGREVLQVRKLLIAMKEYDDGERLAQSIEISAGTNPAEYNWDDDNDGLPNWYEWRYNMNNSQQYLNLLVSYEDIDNDGLTNIEEYQVDDLGSDPFYPDLFN